MGTELTPILTALTNKLDKNLVRNQVWHLLESPLENDELLSHNILEVKSPGIGSGAVVDHRSFLPVDISLYCCSCCAVQDAAVAPVLQVANHQLVRQLKAVHIARHFCHRPPVSELEEKGIIDGEDCSYIQIVNVKALWP